MKQQGRERVWAVWLYRPHNWRKLWWGFGIVLALTVLAQIAVHVHAHFGFDGWPGFNAVYGFGSCALMVIAAKLIGVVLKRPEDYYDDHV